MADLRGFDATQIDPVTDFDPIPAGKYLAAIISSEMKPTKTGTGSYLELTFQVLDGEYKNRLLWTWLNLDNPNRTAVQIARAELSAICRAVGVLSPNDSTELHNLPLVVNVKCKKRGDTGDLVNEIKGFSAKASPAPNAVAATAGSAPPWRRGR